MNKPTLKKDPLFFLIAGEASGDFLGARLMQALKEKTDGHVRFAGVGGPQMEAQGLKSLFPQADLAHMGLVEVLLHLPLILRRMHETVAAALALRPAAIITIDSPDFSLRVAKKLKGTGAPLIHYVAPSVWAWRAGRAKKMARYLDHVLALLPFEPPYFTHVGLPCTFVGHPLVESGVDGGDAARFRTTFNLSQDVLLLTVLPGSRRGEVKRMLPVFKSVVEKLAQRFHHLHIVVPTVDLVATEVENEVKSWPLPAYVVRETTDKYDAFAASHAALACSGTVSIELALARLPAVIAYKLNWFSAMIARRLVRIPFVTLVNIMKKKEVMPEYLQDQCTPDRLVDGLVPLLQESSARTKQLEELEAVAQWLGKDQFVPSEKAAAIVRRVAFPKGEKK